MIEETVSAHLLSVVDLEEHEYVKAVTHYGAQCIRSLDQRPSRELMSYAEP